MDYEFYTPQEVAQKLRLHINTVYEYLRMGKLRAVRFGNRYRITEEDVQRFLDENMTIREGEYQ